MTAAQAAAAAVAAALGSNSSSWRNSCTGQGSNAEQCPASALSMLMACIEKLAALEGLSSSDVLADGDAANMLRGVQCLCELALDWLQQDCPVAAGVAVVYQAGRCLSYCLAWHSAGFRKLAVFCFPASGCVIIRKRCVAVGTSLGYLAAPQPHGMLPGQLENTTAWQLYAVCGWPQLPCFVKQQL